MIRSFLLSVRWLPYMAVIASVALTAFDPGRILSGFRDRIFDIYQRIDPRPYVDPATKGLPGVRFLDIDDASLAELGQWPWPRTLIATLVEKLAQAGAKVVAFDIVFAETDRTSPAEIVKSWPDINPYNEARIAMLGLPGNDQILVNAMRRVPVVAGFILGGESLAAPPVLKQGMPVVGNVKPADFVPHYAGGVAALPILQNAAAGNGALNVVPDPDGIIRQVPLLVALGDTVYPSATVEALRLASTPPNAAIKTSGAAGQQSFGAATGIVSIKAGRYIIPTTAAGTLYLHYTGRRDERRISAKDVLSGTVDPSRLKGAIVWVGTSAAGLRDLRTTPLEAAAAGVEIQVEATESALLGVGLLRPDFARGAEFIYAWIFGIVVAVLVLRSNPYWIGLIAVLVVVTAFGFSWWAFESHRWLLDPIGPSLAALSAFMAGALLRFAETEGERALIRRAFAQYLQEDVVRELAADPRRLKLGGDTRTMSILFCDVRGFTGIAERYKADPAGLTNLINRILTPLTRAVVEQHGTVDKYIGDCIMAFWNAPVDDPDHASHACNCALVILDEIDRLNAQLQQEQPGAPIIRVGIGINTGPVVVGNMGSDLRFDYSVLGDAVNLAARLQSYSGNYGVDIVVGEETAAAARGFALLKIDRLTVKGKQQAADVYALLGRDHVARTETFTRLAADQDALYATMKDRDWDEAEAIARRLTQESPLGPVLYTLHAGRIAQHRATAPEPDWDGAWHADAK